MSKTTRADIAMCALLAAVLTGNAIMAVNDGAIYAGIIIAQASGMWIGKLLYHLATFRAPGREAGR